MSKKTVFAIETATSRGSIALLLRGRVAETRCIGERFEHSRTLIPHAQQLLKSHGVDFCDLDLICVSKGPGSFTGLRVGIAAAKGLALGLGIPVVGISTFDVLFAGYLHSLTRVNASAGVSSPISHPRIHLLFDAQKGEFFAQLRRRSGTPHAPQIILESQIASVVAPNTVLVSPQLSKLRGLLPFPYPPPRGLLTIPPPPPNGGEGQGEGAAGITYDIKDRFPDAADLATLGLKKFLQQKRGDHDLQPFYLRKTDAELLFKNKPRSVFRWERGANA